MVAIACFCLLTYAVYCCESQPYNIKEWKTIIVNPQYPTRKIPLIVHYPDISNNTQSVSFPLMVFNHGGDCKNTWYDYLWQNLVPQGYIIAMPGDYEHFWDYQHEYAAAQRYTLDYLRSSCNNNISCPLYELINNKSIASGHSWGGSASFLSIGNYPLNNQTFLYEFDAAITLSGCGGRNHELNKSLSNISSDKSIFFIGGTNDCICDFNDSNKYYNMVNQNVCKFAADVVNGSHCNMEEASSFGQEECEALEFMECPFHDHKDDIPASKQYDIVNQYMTLFLNATMKYNKNNGSIQQIENQLDHDAMSNVMTSVLINCNQ